MAVRTWLLAAACLLAACGSDSDSTSTTTTGPPPSIVESDAGVTDSTSTTATPQTTPPTTSTTSAPTTTAPPEPDPAGDGVDALPELLSDWVDAEFDPALDPVAIAERAIGFPVSIPVPEQSTADTVSVDGRPGSETGTWDWEWTYTAIAGPDPGDVDITQDGNGPGALALRDTYDPIMASLGFTYSNSTASDPGDPGGPNSVNHVYTADGGTIRVGGVERVADPVFVWLDDDLVGFEDGVMTPGFRIDVGAEVPEGEIPVAILAEVIDAMPELVGTALVSADLDGRTRPADSFAAEWGLRYLALDLTWSIDPSAGAGLLDTIADSFDDARLVAGSDSFFEPGTLEPARVTETADGWILDVVLLDRYPGRLSFDGADNGELRLRMDLEPNREPLLPPA